MGQPDGLIGTTYPVGILVLAAPWASALDYTNVRATRRVRVPNRGSFSRLVARAFVFVNRRAKLALTHF